MWWGWGGRRGWVAGLLDSATGEARLEDPLLASTVKAQQPVTPALLVPLTAPPPLCLSLHTHHHTPFHINNDDGSHSGPCMMVDMNSHLSTFQQEELSVQRGKNSLLGKTARFAVCTLSSDIF